MNNKAEIAPLRPGRLKTTVLGNALGNSIVDGIAGAGRDASGARNRPAGASARTAEQLEEVQITARRLDNNPDAVIDPAFSLTPDEQRNLAANQPDPVAVMELQEALAREELLTGSVASRDPDFWRDEEGLHIVIRGSANELPRVAASTNASALGISDEAIDAEIAARIAAGETTSAADAAWYATKVVGYELWNFATAGFVKRHDARLTAEANGQLSSSNFWTATALDAAGSVGSLYLGGRAGGAVMNRLGSGYTGYIASGAAGGGVFDLTQQGTQLGIHALTSGQTGQAQFSPGELALATGGGAVVGGALRGVDSLNTAWVNRTLAADLANQEYVYRGVSESVLRNYQREGRISGLDGGKTYFSLEGGATPLEQKLSAQLPKEPEVLLRIPVSAIERATVPRPNWNVGWIGREYTINSYPQFGAGGYRQFIGTTSTFSDDWIVQGWGKR